MAGAPSWLYPLCYLTVTHSTIALMIAVGLLGNPVLAADIALAHGATVATFHALSANTRALVLGQSTAISFVDILRVRIALVLPLGAVAFLLAIGGTTTPTWLAACLVLRRCAEWFNDLQMCKAEVEHRATFALRFAAMQGVLFVAAALALVAQWPYAPAVLTVWALVPLGVAVLLARDLRGATHRQLARMLKILFPHVGSTAISGLALFAFRILVVVLLAKALAGELFTAIALGSFIGTLFANVVGQSVELHRQRTGRGLPRPIRRMLSILLGLGIAITAAAIALPEEARVLGKGTFFWLACGLSLIGGVIMAHAVRVRLRILRSDDGRDIFGPEVLIHMALLVVVPFSIVVGGTAGAASIYLVNAVLAYGFYKSSEIAQRRRLSGEASHADRFRVALGFLLVFPLFFQLAGGIYNAKELVVDSGGLILTLPLPVSLLACFGAIVLLADYRRATRSFAFVFLLFATMLLSTVAATATGEAFDRGKLLLLMQILIPAFGLVLGEMFEPDAVRRARVLERSFFWACAIIIPAQLIASWLQGEASLTHWLGAFSVYQHRQFAPVVVASAALIAAPSLRDLPAYRPWVLLLLALSVAYALGAYSVLGIFVASAGLAVYAVRDLSALRLRWGLTAAAIAAIVIGGQLLLLKGTSEYRIGEKLITYQALAERIALPCTDEPIEYASPLIVSQDDLCVLRRDASVRHDIQLRLWPRHVQKGTSLQVEGDIRKGGVVVQLVRTDGTGAIADELHVGEPGPFTVNLHPESGHLMAVMLSDLSKSSGDDVIIRRIAWKSDPAGGKPDLLETVPKALAPILPRNFVERIGDWVLFGQGIFTNTETFLIGHPKPMDRTIRTSAHNYYIDLAYNFGTLALLPLIALIAYTLHLLWMRRRDVLRDDRLFWIAGVVLFLILVDSNFKVTLRQPYSGIFAFFAWGVLLARLRHAETSVATRTVASPADPGPDR